MTEARPCPVCGAPPKAYNPPHGRWFVQCADAESHVLRFYGASEQAATIAWNHAVAGWTWALSEDEK